jgi:ABC-type multidrug transport system fused ATPase/permease subunit
MLISGSRYVLGLLRPHGWLGTRFVLSALARALTSGSFIILVQTFLAAALGDESGTTRILSPGATLAVVGVLLFVVQFAGSLFSYENQVTQQRIAMAMELTLMSRLLRHLLSLSVPFFDRQRPGDIIHAVRQDLGQLRTIFRALSSILFEGILIAGLTAVTIWLSPWLALWALLGVPAASFPLFLFAKRTLHRSHRVRTTAVVLFDRVLQLLRGIRVIKVYRAEEQELHTSLEYGRQHFDEIVQMTRVRSLAQVVLETLAGMGVLVVIVVGGYQVLSGSLAWPALMAFILALRALHGPLNNVTNSYLEAQACGASLRRIDELLAAVPEVRDPPSPVPMKDEPRTIEFREVSFATGGVSILKGVSFAVRGGETIGIVGPSGAGKTTLLSLLARFCEPTGGRILLDGRGLDEHRVSDLYDHLAFVPQDPFLFTGTIADNIRVGRPGASDRDVEAAARAAYLHDEIVGFSQGYSTAVGLGGRELSGGQRQRVNIARALLKNAPILLLDEATSSLDSVAEEQVQRAIERLRKGRTSFLVAHRLSTLRHADRLLVLNEGRCVGFGTHEELLHDCPLYKRLVETQRLDRAAVARTAYR